uniref:Uncharacterized protein n=1 Tax=Rhizophagus irregularis (strain DAOM 181602 / DAOM 197198 / MUCL 43194) TaxID=747089 RepID=U9T4T2_RHIID
MGFFVVCVLKEAKTVISDKVVKVSPTDSFQFHDIFNAATNEQFESYGVQVFLRKPPEKWVYVEEGLEGDISMLFELKFTHIKFVLEATEASVQEPQGPNAFDLLMRNSQLVCLPEQRKEDTRRDLLYNDIIKLLQSKEVGWKSGTHSTLGKSFVERLTAALWYIDPHCTKFTERSLSLGEFFDGLNQYRHDQHYNLFYFTGRHAKYNLMRDKLEQLASSLELSAVQPWATNEQWCNITEEVFILTSSMQKYASNLEKINKSMKQIHLSDTPARHPANDLIVYTIDSCRKIDAQYKQLQDHLLNVDYYTEVDLESFLPKDAIQRYRYIKDLQIQFPVTLYRYYQGNYLGTINYIWKVPSNSEVQSETAHARVITTIQEKLPQYFSRQMRKNYSLVKTITPAILRILYYDLTGDAAVASNSISKELEERLRLMLELEDPSIICDLRQNNGFKGTKFDTFWNEMNAYFNENLPAVNDRRHGNVLYMPLAISIRDLRNIFIQRLDEKFVPGTILIPSEEWIHLQFQPTNPIAKSAKQYTGRFNIKFMVQARQLRKDHPDTHYCATLFRYLREFAILYRQYVSFICADDKHKVPIGEGVNTSTGVRNKKTMVFQETSLVACDHDFTKLSLTPSVIFFCNIPESIENSFYSGKVFVSFKDTVFQSSSAIRHTTEFYNAISTYHSGNIPPILCLYTDGGPDHRTIFGSVQISLICLFLHGDFDMLIAMRTAPHHSWTNPAERIMSILNLGLQGVALVRDVMGPESETAFAKLDTLDEIRTAAKTNPTLQNDLRECIKRVQQLLEGRTERLVLHNEPIQCYNPADETTIDEFFNIILLIDQTLKISETTSDILSKKTHLQQFMKTHCRQRQYVFQIKKCGQSSCTICKSVQLPHDVFDSLDWLPDPIPSTVDKDHYAKFQTVYQSETTEQHRPTLITTIANSERASSSILVNTRVREFIQCFQCGRMRCLYSERALSAEDKIACQIAIDNWDYSCGSPLVPEDHILYNKVFVREKLVAKHQWNWHIIHAENLMLIVMFVIGKDIFVRGEIKTNTRAAKRRKINN